MTRSHRSSRASLSGRISWALAALVAFAVIVMGVASVVALRSWMLADIDAQVGRLAERAQGPDQERGRTGGPGMWEGTLEYVREDDEETAVVVSNFSVRTLDETARRILAAIPTDGRPRDVNILGVGYFRVVARVDASEDSRTVVAGRSMNDVNRISTVLAGVEVTIALLVTVSAAWVGRVWVRRDMKPLRDVEEVASSIAQRDLSSAGVGELTRPSQRSLEGPAEVAEVAAALDSMIDAVEEGMEQRARNEAQLRQFVADASHELRTPLASVQGYAQLLTRDLDEEQQGQAVTRIYSEARRMSDLVEEMLTLARLDGQRQLALTEVDVAPIVVDALSDAQAAGGDHTWVLGELDEVWAVANEGALRQIVANLLTNARVHTVAGTTVSVSVAATGASGVGPAMVRIRVSDDGPGVPEELREHVFDRFVRGDTSRTRDGHGSSGLGLSIVRELVRAMGGEVILMESQVGATFEVSIPRAR